MRPLSIITLLVILITCFTSIQGFSQDSKAEAAKHYLSGVTWLGQGEYDKTIAELNKAIEKRPDYPQAYYVRALALHMKQKYDESIADCNKAIELKPDYAEAYHMRGNGWVMKQELDKAIADNTKAIDLKPDLGHAYNVRGSCWQDKGDIQKAKEDYKKACDLGVESACIKYHALGGM